MKIYWERKREAVRLQTYFQSTVPSLGKLDRLWSTFKVCRVNIDFEKREQSLVFNKKKVIISRRQFKP